MKNTATAIEFVEADYSNEHHRKHIGDLLNAYAEDPMGGGAALPEYVRVNVAQALSEIPGAFSFLCYVDDEPAGLVNCFEGFSTFKCKPLVNIHDIIVLPKYRSQGLSQQLLQRVENIAIARGCCKITLEVLDGNATAKKIYQKFGFNGYELSPIMGKALFWEKPLS